MTERFDIFISAIEKTNHFIVQMFLFALFVIVAYKALEWLPVSIRRHVQYVYLAFLLAAYIFVTVYFAGV